MDDESPLALAVTRLKAFRSTWNSGDVIDEESGLTADDLDEMLALAPPRYTLGL